MICETPASISKSRPPIAWGYRRISRDNPEGSSIETQTDAIERYCAYKLPDIKLIMPEPDRDITRLKRLFERPTGQYIWLNFMPGDHLVVSMFDRAWGSCVDVGLTLEKLRDREIQVHILDFGIDTTTIYGAAFAQIIGAMKEIEVRTCSERTKAVLRWKKKQGLPVAGYRAAVGWLKKGKKKKSHFVPNWRERYICEVIYYLRHTMDMSYDEIGEYLQRNKYPRFQSYRSRPPGRWYRTPVRVAYNACINNYPIYGKIFENMNHDRVAPVTELDPDAPHLRTIQRRNKVRVKKEPAPRIGER